MSANEPLSFRTESGKCEITGEQLILTRSGVRGQVAAMIFGSSIQRTLLIYGGLAGLALVFAVASIVESDYVGVALYGVLALVCTWSAVDARRKAVSRAIDLKSIRRVQAHPPQSPATPGYFTIEFEEQGVTRQRTILLPGLAKDGDAEFQRAQDVLRRAGLTVNA